MIFLSCHCLCYYGLSPAVSFKLIDCLCYFYLPDDQCVIHLEGAELYPACISFNKARYKKELDFANKWKELQCEQVDVAVSFF